MNVWEILGLSMLLAATAITVIILLFDLYLACSRQLTISETTWIELRHWRAGQGPFPWQVVMLPVGMTIGPIGLLIHFLT